jgi:hypothetical protein
MKTAALEAWQKYRTIVFTTDLKSQKVREQQLWQAFKAGFDAGKQYSRDDAAERFVRLTFTDP